MANDGRESTIFENISPSFRALGMRSWLFVGVVAAAMIVSAAMGFAAGLVTPLIVAVVMGMLFYPVIDSLAVRRVPRSVGALIVLFGLAAVAIAAGWLTVNGVVQQSSEIAKQVSAGLDALKVSFADINLDPALVDALSKSASQAVSGLASGFITALSSSLSSAVAFLFGLFIGVFMLFYLLTDWHNLAEWIGAHLGVPARLGAELVNDGTSAMRQYFKGLTISSILVSILIGLAMWGIGLPLAIPIAIVTFLTSYIPYFGAIFSGAFACLIALGAGGLEQALMVLVVVLVTQNVVQTIVQNYYAASELSLHPLVTLIATILGGTIAGLLGSLLGAPLAAFVVRATARFKEFSSEQGQAGAVDTGDADAAPAGSS